MITTNICMLVIDIRFNIWNTLSDFPTNIALSKNMNAYVGNAKDECLFI